MDIKVGEKGSTYTRVYTVYTVITIIHRNIFPRNYINYRTALPQYVESNSKLLSQHSKRRRILMDYHWMNPSNSELYEIYEIYGGNRYILKVGHPPFLFLYLYFIFTFTPSQWLVVNTPSLFYPFPVLYDVYYTAFYVTSRYSVLKMKDSSTLLCGDYLIITFITN